jgi:hypothetical protein
MVEYGNHNPNVVGSNPTIININTEGSIVWLMYLFWEQKIKGSNPFLPILFFNV